MNQQQKDRVADAPASCRALVRRAYESTASPRGAIKAFCLQCVGYERKDVTRCTASACPLFAYRPYQKGAEDDE